MWEAGKVEERGKSRKKIAFILREIHNQIKSIICNDIPKSAHGPRTQLQGGILGYLYHHQDQPVYQRDIEREFRISRATATNTLQVMEKNGVIVRKSQDKDARLKRILMTDEALHDHTRVERHMEMMDEKLLCGMSGEEIGELYRLLGIIMANLEEMRGETARAPADSPR